MKLVTDFVVAILLFLIKIGDGVLFLLRALKRCIVTVVKAPLRLFSKTQRPQRGRPRKLQPNKTTVLWQYRKTEPKKQKSHSFFLLPFMTKMKYFVFGGIFSLLFIFVPLIVVVFLQDLPSPQELTLRQIPQTTKIYDRNGVLLYQVYASQNRTVVPLSDIPLNLQNATIAIEDKDFYKHPGFDISGIARSFVQDVTGKDFQGGSTITQQLIKSALLSPEATLSRKLKEVVLAFGAERIYSKKQLLGMYFNQIPYGGTAWGAEAAAQIYFDKDVKDIDLAESAFLAGIPRAPTIYSPFGSNPTLWKKRQKEVLARMVELGYITREQAKEATAEELQFRTQQIPIRAPHFVMYVKDLLVQKYGLPIVERGGLNVYTSLDLSTQEKVQKIVSDQVTQDSGLLLSNGAALVTNPKNGDILAMVGSRDYSYPGYGAVNLTTSLRQPGSSIKMITYATALSHGYTAATILDDVPTSFPDGINTYSPVNYDGKFHGRVPLRTAFANSFNIPAVRVLNQVGIPAMVQMAQDMGITTWNDPSRFGLSLTLGGGEVKMVDMATAYGVVANGGYRVDLNPFLKITDSKGTVLEEKTQEEENPSSVKDNPDSRKVLDEGVAFIISDILADNNARTLEFGPNSPLKIPNHFVSVKTGTTDWKRDNWTIGFTPNYLTAVWVGNNDNTPMSQSLASGITGAAPIWNKIMVNLLSNTPDTKPLLPSYVVQKYCFGHQEYFVRGTENSVNCAPIPVKNGTPAPGAQNPPYAAYERKPKP